MWTGKTKTLTLPTKKHKQRHLPSTETALQRNSSGPESFLEVLPRCSDILSLYQHSAKAPSESALCCPLLSQ